MANVGHAVKQRHADTWGLVEAVQSLTGAASYTTASTGVRISGFGLTVVALTKAETAACNWALELDSPPVAGVHKYIALSRATGASTYELRVMAPSTLTTFYGSTGNCLLFTTDWVSPAPATVHLIGVTSAAWAVVGGYGGGTTQWAVVGSTKGNT
jgi:hypothetical protein